MKAICNWYFHSTKGVINVGQLDTNLKIKKCWKFLTKNSYFIGLVRLTHRKYDGLELDYHYKRKACKYT